MGEGNYQNICYGFWLIRFECVSKTGNSDSAKDSCLCVSFLGCFSVCNVLATNKAMNGKAMK